MIQRSKTQVDREQSLQALNFLMRGELAAAEAYRAAITLIPGDATFDLERCQESHDRRAVQLAEHITLAGGTPVTGGGPWGPFTRGGPDASAMTGRTSLLAALEEGEEQSLSDYRTILDLIDDDGVTLVRNELLPEQVRTLGIISMLRRRSGH